MENSQLMDLGLSTMGYQPHLFKFIAEIQDRIVCTHYSSLLSIQTIYVTADDLNDPSVTANFNHLSSQIILSRSMAVAGIHPAIDHLNSFSKNINPKIVGERHFTLVNRVKEMLSKNKEIEARISIIGMESVTEEDKILSSRARKLINYFSQPMITAERFTGIKGVSVTTDTI